MISFCWHEWAPWSEIVDAYTGPRQFKYCKKCNQIKHRKVARSSIDVNTLRWNHKPSSDLDD